MALALLTRLLSFSLIAVLGFLLLVSLVASAAWQSVAAHLRTMLASRALAPLIDEGSINTGK